MNNINSMEMAQKVLSSADVEKKSVFFGLSHKYLYKPTGSLIKGLSFEMDKTHGLHMLDILDASDTDVRRVLNDNGAIVEAPIGCYKLDACLSEDGQFASLQLFSFKDFEYSAVGDAHIYKGENALAITNAIMSRA